MAQHEQNAFSTFNGHRIAQRPIQKSKLRVQAISSLIHLFLGKLCVSQIDFYIIENDRTSFMTKYRRKILLLIGSLIASLIMTSEADAQNRGAFIYGKVTTYSGEYQGQIRWGTEEAIWLDHFNAAKVSSTVEVDDVKSSDWSVVSIWKDNKAPTKHQFSCEFGDIKEISGIGKSRFTLVYKNGTSIVLDGQGYNDVGTTLRVEDEELGLVKLKWEKIKKIEFFDAKHDFPLMLGEHLYGRVTTNRKGNFEGYVIWDHDERLGDEKLDGEINREDVAIPFKNITSIEAHEDGCEVEMKSGRSHYVTGSNDVNKNNRGVIVMNRDMGYIEIPWSYVEKVDFFETNDTWSYNDFKKPEGIFGQVYTENDQSYSGRLVYDLDEYWELELIEGRDDKLEYQIPIRNIRRIEPKNDSYSEIQLKNGEVLLLGKLRDVAYPNAGVLVMYENGQKPKHIDWDDILEIVLD